MKFVARSKNAIPKLKRLIGILVELNKRDWLSANEIASMFSISLRSVYRDVSELQNMGFQIVGTTGTMGGYRLAQKKTVEHEMELDIYNKIKLELLVKLGRHTIESALQEENQILDKNIPDSVYALKDKMIFDVSDWYWKDSIEGYSCSLSRSIQNQTTISINYKKRGSNENIHDFVNPLGMAWKAGFWYLICDSKYEKSIIRIRSNRILSVVETERSFCYPKGFNLSSWWKKELVEFGRGNIEIVLKVSGQSAVDEWMKMEEKPDTIKVVDQGILTVKYYVDKWNWLVPIILSYGDSVLVVKPIELKEVIRKTIKRTLYQYKVDNFASEQKKGFENDDSRERISKSRQE